MILMLCGIMESGKKKCEQYWPAKMGQSMTSGLIAIKNLKQTDTEKSCTSSTLELTCQGERLKVEHVFWMGGQVGVQFQRFKTPYIIVDRGVPEKNTITLRLIKRTIGMAPILVHCSAGIGRTGTIVGLDMCQQMMNAGEKVNMHEIVKELRISARVRPNRRPIHLHAPRPLLLRREQEDYYKRRIFEFLQGSRRVRQGQGRIIMDAMMI
ncbi:hypothetical protein L596_025032 [Steinernema carpocapsae]|nr:hypothetical protein L596_025032 [Steinernema carpocapsae]